MKKKSFNFKNEIIKLNLKINWKLILFFAILWFLFVFIAFILESSPYIAPTNVITIYTNNHHQRTYYFYYVDTFNTFVFSFPAILFFSIISFTFIFLSINKELESGQIFLWMCSNLSRNKIILQKIFFIWIALMIIYFPGFIFTIIFFSLKQDASYLIGYIILDLIMFFIFIIMLTSIYTIISLSLSDKKYLWLIISSMILVYMMIMWILMLIYNSNPEGHQSLKFIQYISLESLYVKLLNFESLDNINNIDISQLEPGIYYYSAALKPVNIGWTIGSILINLSIIIGLTFWSSYIFKNKDLKI